jgi:hypothetical protein
MDPQFGHCVEWLTIPSGLHFAYQQTQLPDLIPSRSGATARKDNSSPRPAKGQR